MTLRGSPERPFLEPSFGQCFSFGNIHDYSCGYDLSSMMVANKNTRRAALFRFEPVIPDVRRPNLKKI